MPPKPCIWPSPTPTIPTAIQEAPTVINFVAAEDPRPPLPPFAAPQYTSDFLLGNPIHLYLFATLARCTYYTNNSYWNRAVNDVWPASYGNTFVPNSGETTPGYGLVVSPNAAFLVISGTTNLAQWCEQIFSGPMVPTSYGAGGIDKAYTMATYKASADAIDTATSALISPSKPVILCGHSMGGAVATILYYKWALAGSHANSKLLTFGAPKPGNFQLRSGVPRDPDKNRRILLQGDFVPGLPPDLGALGAVAPEPFSQVAVNWSRYEHTTSPYYVDSPTSILQGDEPFLVAMIIAAMLTAALGQPIDLGIHHKAGAYTGSLRPNDDFFPPAVTRGWRNPNDLVAINRELEIAGIG